MKVGTSKDEQSWLRPGQRITVGISLCIALIISCYLGYMKLTGQISSLHGCGSVEGCANLLGGRWANLFGIPVSFLAIATYAALTVLVTTGGSGTTRIALTLSGGMLLFLAAGWFLSLQIFIEHHFCSYCMALHTCGVTVFCILLSAVITRDLPGCSSVLRTAILASTTATAILILGQVYGPQPDSHVIIEVVAADMRPPAESSLKLPESVVPSSLQATIPSTTESSPAPVAPPRTLSYLDGHVRYTLGRVPLIGDPMAEHILVKYFDYTCPGCRELHFDLDKVMALDPHKFAIIVIPTPLHHDCNPHVPAGIPEHPGACELARLSLAVWRANPGKFRALHEKLFLEQNQISVLQAREFAVGLVGEDAIASAEKDPSIGIALDQSISIYRVLSRSDPRLPKLLLGGKRLVNGVPRDMQALKRLLDDAFAAK
jgi:uncharacterized membrane protein/protein-disulfide isomerase